MPTTKACSFIGPAAALAWCALSAPAAALTTGDNGTHDPSRMIESNGKFYVYSTGGGSKWSADGLAWTRGPAIFPNGFPDWVKTRFPTNQGAWAPDIIRLNGQYYLYYSVAGLPKKSCGIGLVTSPTLDPNSPDYKWTDRGLVVANDEVVKYATIDPAPVLDADGNLWVVWGGGYANPNDAQSIWVTRLDNMTGLPSPSDSAKPGHPLLLGHKEGPYLHYHSGYYYVFWQTGSCCDGTSSTYTVHMARSKSITGPYDGDKIFYQSHDNVHGPGHIGIYSACGVERFTYHYYPTNSSILGENSLSWNDDWPVAGPEATTPLMPCEGPGTPGTGGTGAAGGSAGSANAGNSSNMGGGGTSTTNAGGTPNGGSGGGSSSAGSTTFPSLAGSTNTPTAGSGAALTPADDASTDTGCTCTLEPSANRSRNLVGSLLAIALSAAAAWRRRQHLRPTR